MSLSDPTPENLAHAADCFDAAYESPFPHHVSVMLREAAERIQQLMDGINRAGAYLSQGEPNIARETLAALLKENDK